MARQINALVIHDETVSAALVAAHIAEDSGLELVAVLDTLEPSEEQLRELDADVLLVACREGSDAVLRIVQGWRELRAGRPVVVLSHDTDQDFVKAAFAAGADDLVALAPGPYVPEQSRREIEFALRKVVTRNLAAGDRASDAGTLIAVLGSKGGVGKTVTATNLGVALARRGRRTALVDLDLQFGDVALALALAPETTIFDLAVSGGSLDAEKLDDFMLRHASGLRVLAAPTRPDQAGSVTAEMLSEIYALLRGEYDFVIVDTPPLFAPEVIATVDVASAVCMVGALDALSLKNTRLGLETLDLMGYPQEQVHVALNRAGSNVGISEEDAISILGRRPQVAIPSDRAIPSSINDGVPVVISARRSDTAKAFEALADQFVHTPAEAAAPADGAPKRRRSLLRSRKSSGTIRLAQVKP